MTAIGGLLGGGAAAGTAGAAGTAATAATAGTAAAGGSFLSNLIKGAGTLGNISAQGGGLGDAANVFSGGGGLDQKRRDFLNQFQVGGDPIPSYKHDEEVNLPHRISSFLSFLNS